jgi:hypothetical protein
VVDTQLSVSPRGSCLGTDRNAGKRRIAVYEDDVCDCRQCRAAEATHKLGNERQLEYFKAREKYRNLSHTDLVAALKEFSVPEVLLEVLENRLAGLQSV